VGNRSLAFSPDGKWLAGFGDRGDVQVLDCASQRVVTSRIVSRPRYGSAGVVAFAPEGSRLAIGEDYGRIRLLDLKTGSWLSLSNQLGLGVTALAFSPKGDLLAAGHGYGSGVIRLWDPRTQETARGMDQPHRRCDRARFHAGRQAACLRQWRPDHPDLGRDQPL